MKKLGFPVWLRWKWLKLSSRDNTRTPYQWNAGKGAGFSTGQSWLGINANHTQLNYEFQQNDPDSVLSFYKKMINLRKSSEVLKYGDFKPLVATNKLLIYSRESSGDAYIIACNFSDKRIKLNSEARVLLQGKLAVSNIGRTEWNTSQTRLEAWEALVLHV